MFYEFTLTTGETRLVNLDEVSMVSPLENNNTDISLSNGIICTVRMSYSEVKDVLIPVYSAPKSAKVKA